MLPLEKQHYFKFFKEKNFWNNCTKRKIFHDCVPLKDPHSGHQSTNASVNIDYQNQNQEKKRPKLYMSQFSAPLFLNTSTTNAGTS